MVSKKKENISVSNESCLGPATCLVRGGGGGYLCLLDSSASLLEEAVTDFHNQPFLTAKQGEENRPTDYHTFCWQVGLLAIVGLMFQPRCTKPAPAADGYGAG